MWDATWKWCSIRQTTGHLGYIFDFGGRPVEGGEAGGLEPPRKFQIWIKFATKVELCLLKWTAVNESYSFHHSVDHSKTMYCWSSVQFGIVQRNEIIVFLLCQKQLTALKHLHVFHQNRKKQNGSKCTNDNLWTWPLGLFWFLRGPPV